jgi:hypothetical protein
MQIGVPIRRRVLTLLALLLLTGCHGGSEYVTDNFGGRPSSSIAPSDATYVIHACTCDGATGDLPRVELRKGQPLGFTRSSAGQMEAFAGDKHFPLQQNREYTWMRVTTPFEEGIKPVIYGGMFVAEIVLLPIEIPILLTWHGAS